MNDNAWLARAPWPFPPPWAKAWGDDHYGLWADFALQPGSVVQRMRWIEAGSFDMGSPNEELERLDREGPQHRVSISKGFWLADTACTQALWLAVTGENPSRFKDGNGGGPDHPVERHPVENVSWNMIQAFLPKLNAMLPGCFFTLPTEAEWEYACRANSVMPFGFGETITTGQVNYYGNYPYGNGKKGEYRKCTVSVKALAANNWGLYQMHGNVWEWCHDALREYTMEPVFDPGLTDAMNAQEGGELGGAARALRGGSWNSRALYARSAYRSAYGPGWHDINTGFRLACRSSSPASAEP
jgi:formylglycine-generating enzyme